MKLWDQIVTYIRKIEHGDPEHDPRREMHVVRLEDGREVYAAREDLEGLDEELAMRAKDKASDDDRSHATAPNASMPSAPAPMSDNAKQMATPPPAMPRPVDHPDYPDLDHVLAEHPDILPQDRAALKAEIKPETEPGFMSPAIGTTATPILLDAKSDAKTDAKPDDGDKDNDKSDDKDDDKSDDKDDAPKRR